MAAVSEVQGQRDLMHASPLTGTLLPRPDHVAVGEAVRDVAHLDDRGVAGGQVVARDRMAVHRALRSPLFDLGPVATEPLFQRPELTLRFPSGRPELIGSAHQSERLGQLQRDPVRGQRHERCRQKASNKLQPLPIKADVPHARGFAPGDRALTDSGHATPAE